MALDVPPSGRKTVTSLPPTPTEDKTFDVSQPSDGASGGTNSERLFAKIRSHSEATLSLHKAGPDPDIVPNTHAQRRPRPRDSGSRRISNTRKSSFRRSAISSFNPFGPIIFEGALPPEHTQEEVDAPYQRKSFSNLEEGEKDTWDSYEGKTYQSDVPPPNYYGRNSSFTTLGANDIEKVEKCDQKDTSTTDPNDEKLRGWKPHFLTVT